MHRTTKRERSDDEARRTRSRLSQQDGGCLAASCSKTHLPGEILALPHVVTAIKQFLMTPEKAIIEAARLGQEERLDQLLTKYMLRSEWASHVGRYIVPHVKDKKYVHGTKAAGILAHAISARHMDVVEYLFGQDSSWWDLAEAFIAAVAVEQHTLADRIFEAYRREDKEAFLVEVAGHEGNLQAVKYLYYNGQNNSELISDAFVSAANYSHIATMEFLTGI
ncbi:hypothetical protein GQ600_16266 [Phytophthora cactorum]|nr:hypothetical protein GQ600_16266 [Phytophthora cactorum]